MASFVPQPAPHQNQSEDFKFNTERFIPLWLEIVFCWWEGNKSDCQHIPAWCPHSGLGWTHTHTQHVTLLPTELCHKYNTAFQFIYLIYKTLWYQYFVSAYWYIFYYMKITLFINCSDKCISIIRVCCKSVKTNLRISGNPGISSLTQLEF